MKLPKLILCLSLLLTSSGAFARNKNKWKMVEVIMMDGGHIKGLVKTITIDYLIIDASKHSDPSALKAYYIRPDSLGQRVDVEYIRAIIARSKKHVLKNAAAGAAAGALIAGSSSTANQEELSDVVGTAAFGASAGAVIGGISGVSKKKKVFAILGNSAQLMEVNDYLGLD